MTFCYNTHIFHLVNKDTLPHVRQDSGFWIPEILPQAFEILLVVEIWNPSSTAKEPEWSTWDQESVAWIPESTTISLVFSTFALQPHVHHSFLSEKLHYLLCSFCSFCQDCSFGLKLMCPLQGKLVYVSAFYLKDLFYIFIHARLSQLILAHVLYLLFCKFVKLYD